MRAKHISDVNEAILVLRHFVELSAKLLPFLDELDRKKAPSVKDLESRKKIIDVYKNYEFDTNTSRILMNSDVLKLIKDTFDHICERKSHGKKRRSGYLLKFLREHERLQQNWGMIQAN